jgi:hypothetical protein
MKATSIMVNVYTYKSVSTVTAVKSFFTAAVTAVTAVKSFLLPQ